MKIIRGASDPRSSHRVYVRTQIIRNGQALVDLALQHTTKQHRAIRSPELFNPLLDDGAEMSHEALDRPRSCIPEGTYRPALDLFAMCVI